MRALTMDELKFVSGGSDVVEKVNVTAKRKPSDPSNPFPSIGTQTETVTVPSRKGNTLDLDFDATEKPDPFKMKGPCDSLKGRQAVLCEFALGLGLEELARRAAEFYEKDQERWEKWMRDKFEK